MTQQPISTSPHAYRRPTTKLRARTARLLAAVTLAVGSFGAAATLAPVAQAATGSTTASTSTSSGATCLVGMMAYPVGSPSCAGSIGLLALQQTTTSNRPTSSPPKWRRGQPRRSPTYPQRCQNAQTTSAQLQQNAALNQAKVQNLASQKWAQYIRS